MQDVIFKRWTSFLNLNQNNPLPPEKCSHHLWLLSALVWTVYCWVDKTFTLLLPKILLNEIKLHIEIPKTKFWSQAAFSDTMECPASNGSECTWSCTIYFQKIFPTSDDSARKNNIKELRKVTILLCNPRLMGGREL